MSPNKRLNNIILERTIEYNTTLTQDSTAEESSATLRSRAHGKTKVYMAYARAYMFVISYHVSVTVNNYDVT